MSLISQPSSRGPRTHPARTAADVALTVSVRLETPRQPRDRLGIDVAIASGMAPQPVTTSTPRTQQPPPPPPPPKTQAASATPAAPATPKGHDTTDKFEPAAAGNKPKAEVWGPRYEDVKAGRSVLAPNTRGPAIERMQKELSAAGYSVPTDGKYDARTKTAVEDYQKAHGLKPGPQSPAGWADQKTLETLESDMAARRAVAGKFPAGSEDRKTMVELMRSPGFNKLDNAERDRFLKTMGGDDAGSKAGRDTLKSTLLDKGYSGFSGDAQADLLRTFQKSDLDLPTNVRSRSGEFDGKPADFSTRRTQDLSNYEVHEMKVGDQTIEITRSKNGNDKTPTVEEVEKAIASMPEHDRKQVKSVFISGGSHKDGPDVKAAYDDSNGTVAVFNHADNRDTKDLAGTITHEAGHGAGHEKLGPDGSAKWKEWEAAAAKDGIPPSQYGAKNSGEDFAETYRLFRSVKGTAQYDDVKARYPARFEMLEKMGE